MSRLIVGTGKYPSHAIMAQAHAASGTEMVTVAVRRVNISDRSKESLLDYIDNSIFILIGDHQPPQVSRRADGWATPVHVIAQDAAFVDAFAPYGFTPGLRVPARVLSFNLGGAPVTLPPSAGN